MFKLLTLDFKYQFYLDLNQLSAITLLCRRPHFTFTFDPLYAHPHTAFPPWLTLFEVILFDKLWINKQLELHEGEKRLLCNRGDSVPLVKSKPTASLFRLLSVDVLQLLSWAKSTEGKYCNVAGVQPWGSMTVQSRAGAWIDKACWKSRRLWKVKGRNYILLSLTVSKKIESVSLHLLLCSSITSW